MGNRKVLNRVEQCLLNATRAMSTPEISDAIGASRTSVSEAIKKLHGQYGSRMISKAGHGWSWHKIASEAPQQSVIVVADLWRGWVNPATGRAPERLGL